METLMYPLSVDTFEKFFIKLDVYDSRVNINKTAPEIEASIYLPLPKGLLREDYQLEYSKKELGVLGETVKEKYQSVKNSLSNIVSGGGSIFDIEPNIIDNSLNMLDTWIDQEIMKTENIFFKIGSQAAGYTRAPNFTLLFDGISRVRDFTLEWNLYPKNEEDAMEIEKIIKYLQKSTLPELSNFSYLNELVNFVLPQDTLLNNPEPADLQKTNDVLPVQREIASKLYSSTYILPKQFKISIMERVGKQYTEIKNLMNYPHFMVMHEILTYYGSKTEASTFIKGEQGYYHSSYDITMNLMENKLYTANHVED